MVCIRCWHEAIDGKTKGMDGATFTKNDDISTEGLGNSVSVSLQVCVHTNVDVHYNA